MADTQFVTDGRTDGRCDFYMLPEVPSGHKNNRVSSSATIPIHFNTVYQRYSLYLSKADLFNFSL